MELLPIGETVYIHDFLEMNAKILGSSVSISDIVRLHSDGIIDLYFRHEPVRAKRGDQWCFIDETKAYPSIIREEHQEDNSYKVQIERPIEAFALTPYQEYKVFKFRPILNTETHSIVTVTHIKHQEFVSSLLKPKNQFPSETVYLKGADVENYFKTYFNIIVNKIRSKPVKTQNNLDKYNKGKKEEALESLNPEKVCEDLKKLRLTNTSLTYHSAVLKLVEKYKEEDVGVSSRSSIERRVNDCCPEIKDKFQEKK